MKYFGIKTYLLLLITVLIASCEKTETQNEGSNKNSCENQIIIDEDLFQIMTNDSLTIITSTIVDDEIQVRVEYLGGCGEQVFQLLTHGSFAESLPVQLEVLLAFENNDSCNTIVQEDICFDLTNLLLHYEENYQVSEGTIILKLQHYDSDLNYSF